MSDGGRGRDDRRVCIQTKRVFDAAIKRITLSNVPISVSDITILNPDLPLRYLGARSTTSKGIINNLTVTRLSDRQNRNIARVAAAVEIPLEVRFVDDSNTPGRGVSLLSVNVDIVMTLPRQSVMPYEVEAVVSAVSTIGSFVGTTVIDGEARYLFGIDCCITIIMKIVAEVELIVTSHGYCTIPHAKDYAEAVCEGFFGLPLFPE